MSFPNTFKPATQLLLKARLWKTRLLKSKKSPRLQNAKTAARNTDTLKTKGGFDRSGNSQDIDLYTPKKFGVLKAYLDEHGLKCGIVRNDATTDELCICMDHYSDDIGSDDWQVLESVLP